MHNSALFLDRDGVINVDRGYIHRPDQCEFVPGIFDLARFWTNELERPIVVVTNQSGIGRFYFDENAYADLTRWMCECFEAEGTAIAWVYHCPYHPLDGHRRIPSRSSVAQTETGNAFAGCVGPWPRSGSRFWGIR
jgi:D-glycero-D-manno-heptose 1,7-bisphosphate phosphatase